MQYIRTELSDAVSEIRIKSRWCEMGTPVQNQEKDMYTNIKFLNLKPFIDWRLRMEALCQ